jgi:putative nucleotidyltransferase with HDIG domain
MVMEVAEELVRALVVALMNSLLYFSGHRRVREATEAAVHALEPYFQDQPVLLLGIRESLLIFEGRPLYDLSIYAHRLIRAVRDLGAWGIRFERGVTADEVRRLVEVLLPPSAGSTTLKYGLPEEGGGGEAGGGQVSAGPVGAARGKITPAEASARSEAVNAQLRQEGITHVALETQPLVERGVVGPAAAEGMAPAAGGEEVSRSLYSAAMSVLQDLMVELRQGRSPSFNDANEVAQGIAEAFDAHRTPLIALTAIKDYDEYTFNHSINVCIYTTALARELTTAPRDIVRIAQAALLHDVGKILIADEILYKPGSLSDAEWQVMRQHPLVGAKILVEASGVDELAVNVAFGHHLHYDRKGYPKVAPDITLDPITELINIIDVYEAVTAKRPYKEPFPPERVTKLLLDGSGTLFDPVCVEAFLRSFGVYPPGTRVLLASGHRAEVLSVNPERLFDPIVRLTHDPEGRPLEAGEVVNTATEEGAAGEGATAGGEGGETRRRHAIVHSLR